MTRIAYLTYSTAEFDGRTQRMARTALAADHEVVVYARWREGLPFEERASGYVIIRVPAFEELAIPWRRDRGRQGVAAARKWQIAAETTGDVGSESARTSWDSPAEATGRTDTVRDGLSWVPKRLRGTIFGRPLRAFRRIVVRPFVFFPLRPLGWAVALEEIAGPADIWHGMWAGSLPALVRLRTKHGGRAIYDSRDVYMRSRGYERMGMFKAPFAWLERHWARKVDAVLTVNDSYSALLSRRFGIDRPPVVHNTPNRYDLPSPAPDLIREALALGTDTRIVLYQGGLLSDRGIEQGMEAIADVPSAIFAIMGFGSAEAGLRTIAASHPHHDRIRFLAPVPPEQLLDWTASSDVMLMAIQPTSVNHKFTTPQKMWEAIAAGTPVVASDLPGMARVVRDVGAGVLVDATDPAAIARGILEIVDAPAEERRAMRERVYRAGQETYNWENETEALLALYRDLLARRQRRGRSSARSSISAT